MNTSVVSITQTYYTVATYFLNLHCFIPEDTVAAHSSLFVVASKDVNVWRLAGLLLVPSDIKTHTSVYFIHHCLELLASLDQCVLIHTMAKLDVAHS